MRRLAGLTIVVCGLALLYTDAGGVRAADHPLEGVWQVVDAAGRPSSGVYIFTATHYSMIVANPERPDVADISKATADELRAMWGPLAANAGVYETNGDLLTIRPIAAKIPVVMKPGAFEVYAFQVAGETLSLTQRQNARGVKVERAPATKLVKVE